MELINITPLGGLTYLKYGPRGRGWDVVVLRGAFRPDAQGVLQLIDGDHTLSLADTYHGEEPLLSALRHESDLIWTKPACDVIVAGHAHAPHGQAAARWFCGVQIGPHRHAMTVTGPRRWRKHRWKWRLDEPQATRQVRLDYSLAFGGDPTLGQGKKSEPWADNPVGVGWYHAGSMNADQDYAAPQFETLDRPYKDFDRKYSALGFSPLSRWWPARARFAGTYDQRWLEQNGRWLADDFDTRFFNGAPELLQVPYPRPGERLALLGLWPSREVVTSMYLPAGFPIAEFHRPSGFEFDVPMNLDTVLVDTDEELVHLTWRLAVRQDTGTTACATSWPHWKQEFFRAQGVAASPAHALVTAAQEAMTHG
jgi:hypothetical protein